MEHPLIKLFGDGTIRRYCDVATHAHVHELILEADEAKIMPGNLSISAPLHKNVVLSEVAVNNQKFVMEETLFAAWHEVDRLREALDFIMHFPNGVGDHSPSKVAAKALEKGAKY